MNQEEQVLSRLGQTVLNKGEDNKTISKYLLDFYRDLQLGGYAQRELNLKRLPDPVNGEIRVSGEYLITGSVNIGTNQIVLEGDTTFVSTNPAGDQLLYTGADAAITGTGYTFTAFFTAFITPAGKVFDITGGPDKMLSMLYCGVVSQAQPSIIRDYGDLVSFEFCYITSGAGFEFDGTIGKAAFFITPFNNITGPEIKTLAGFDGLLVASGNFFKDMGGAHLEVVNTANMRARITNNDFIDPTANNFVGFSEATPGFIVSNNTSQIDSGVFLDASFSGNTTAQTVTTAWSDVNTDYTINYSQRISYDSAENAFVVDSETDTLLTFRIDSYIESASNSADFDFGIFVDSGSGYQLVQPLVPFTFRFADQTDYVSIPIRTMVTPGSKFKLQVKKPSGSSNLTFLSSKAII